MIKQTGVKCKGIYLYILQFVFMTFLSAGWWGLLYPNMGLTKETYQIVYDSEESRKEYLVREERSVVEDFFDMLQEEPGNVEVKSRLLEWLEKQGVNN